MKKTSVTPSATFDQMPRPSQSAKIGASTTRGSAFIIFHVRIEHRGGPRLAREPETDQHASDRADHEGEDQLDQCHPKMLPDHAAREPGDDLFRHVNRIGKEERRQQQFAENGISGEHVPERDAQPPPPCTCNRRRLMRDIAINILLVARLCETSVADCWNRPMMPAEPLMWPLSFSKQLQLGQPRRQGFRVQIGRDRYKSVMMRRSRAACTGPYRYSLLRSPFAANILVGRFAGLPLGKRQ